jgi:hypothetical protein
MVGGSPTDAAFVRELHRTLAHLYDPSELRRAQLIDLLRVGKSADPAARDAPPTVTTEPRRPLCRRASAPRPARAIRRRSFGGG